MNASLSAVLPKQPAASARAAEPRPSSQDGPSFQDVLGKAAPAKQPQRQTPDESNSAASAAKPRETSDASSQSAPAASTPHGQTEDVETDPASQAPKAGDSDQAQPTDDADGSDDDVDAAAQQAVTTPGAQNIPPEVALNVAPQSDAETPADESAQAETKPADTRSDPSTGAELAKAMQPPSGTSSESQATPARPDVQAPQAPDTEAAAQQAAQQPLASAQAKSAGTAAASTQSPLVAGDPNTAEKPPVVEKSSADKTTHQDGASRSSTSESRDTSARPRPQTPANPVQSTPQPTSETKPTEAQQTSQPSKTLTNEPSGSPDQASGQAPALTREFNGRTSVAEQAVVANEPARTSTQDVPQGSSTSTSDDSASTRTQVVEMLSTSTDGSRSNDAQQQTSNGGSDSSGGAAAMDVGRTQQADRPQASAPASTSLDVQRMVDRMVSFVRTNIAHDRASIEMRLNPPELGTLRVSMSVQKGQVDLSLQTSTEAARVAVTQHAGQLREALSQQGLQVNRLDVSLGQSFAQAHAQQQSFQDGRRFAGRGAAYQPVPENESPVEQVVSVSRLGSRHLDLVA